MSGALRRAGVAGSETYDKLQRRQDRLNSSVNLFTGMLQGMGVALGGAAIFGFGKKILTAGMEIEHTRTTFGTLMQDMQQGTQLVKDLQEYAENSSFDFKGLADSAQLMLAYGSVAQDKVLPTLKMMGDIAGGNAQKMYSLSLGFSQMASTGRLMGQDLNQMINAGFNPLQEISRTTGIAVSDLRKRMEKGAISVEMVSNAFKTATSEGGRFYKGEERAAQTLQGKYNSMVEGIQALMTQIGEKTTSGAKNVVDAITGWVDKIRANLDNIMSTISIILKPLGILWNILWGIVKALASAFGWLNQHRGVLMSILWVLGSMTAAYYALRLAAMANNAVTAISTMLAYQNALAGRSVTIWQGLAALATKGFTGAMKALNLTMMLNPVFWIVTGIIALIAAIAYVIYKTDGWGKAWKHTIEGAKLMWKAFAGYVEGMFTTMVKKLEMAMNGIVMGYYMARKALGIGDKGENQQKIDELLAKNRQRQVEINTARDKVKADAAGAAEQFKLAGQSLKWNKDRSIGDLIGGLKKKLGVEQPTQPATGDPASGEGVDVLGGLGGSGIDETAKGITGGGSRPTTINITLGNLVEQITITPQTMKDGADDMADKVQEALLRVLNSANGVAYGN